MPFLLHHPKPNVILKPLIKCYFKVRRPLEKDSLQFVQCLQCRVKKTSEAHKDWALMELHKKGSLEFSGAMFLFN